MVKAESERLLEGYMWCAWWLLLHCGVTDTAGSCSCQWSELLFAARAQRHLHLQYLHCRHIKLLSGTSVQTSTWAASPECSKEIWSDLSQAA